MGESDKTKTTEGTRGVGARVRDALKEGAKRAPVELALDEGQKLVVKELLRGYKGTRGERDGARKFLLWFMSTSAGQVAIAGVVSGVTPLVAGFVGKDGPVVQLVADEFAARAATVATREGMRLVVSRLKPLLSVFLKLFDAAEASLSKATPSSLGDGARRESASTFDDSVVKVSR